MTLLLKSGSNREEKREASVWFLDDSSRAAVLTNIRKFQRKKQP